MLGIMYMAIVFLFGCVLVRKLVNIDSIYETISEGLFAKVVPESLLLIPMGMTFGTAVATFFNYFVIYGLYLMSHNLPKSYSAGIVITVLVMMI